MKYFSLLLVFLIGFSAHAQLPGGNAMHCGYDFTSYVVLDVHENGKTDKIPNLRIVVVDSVGKELINVSNMYSWNNSNKPLTFTSNYRIDANGKKLADGASTVKERWFFPFAKDNYLLSVANTFQADRFSIKIEDVDGIENGGKFKTVILPLNSYNMYILCSNESQQAAVKFGRKTNKPVDVVMEKE